MPKVLNWQVIPILRAGLALAEHASAVLPATKTYHLGKEKLLHFQKEISQTTSLMRWKVIVNDILVSLKEGTYHGLNYLCPYRYMYSDSIVFKSVSHKNY